MIELVLVYCLAAEVDRCLEPREARQEVSSPIACIVQAQATAQTYVQAHPKYRLQGWRCEVDKPRERPA